MEQRKIILDCDPGHDDAVAIMLLGHNKAFNLLGITTVSGNQILSKVTKNADNLDKFLDINAGVYKGADNPLIRKKIICAEIHGESGLDGFEFPKYNYEEKNISAAQFIIDTLKKNDKVTLITTGPLTNVALALLFEPSIKKHIQEIIIMGGSYSDGNITPAAEFNILCDPEAAHIIFSSSLPIKMIGLDVTRRVIVDQKVIDRFKNLDNECGKLFVDLMQVFYDNQKKYFSIEGAPLHDPVTVISLMNSEVVKFKSMNVKIDINHGDSYGRTNCDRFNLSDDEKNVQVAVDIDEKLYFDTIYNHLKNNY